jgi:hypothetical protein
MADLKKLLATTRLLGKKFRADVLVAGFSLLVIAKSLLSSREDDIRSWGNVLVYFSHKLIQCHTKLRGWGYIFVGLLASQAYAKMLLRC